MISGFMGRSGSTKVEKISSVTWPFFSTTAPISVITSRWASRPVVSKSKQTYSPEKGTSIVPRTVGMSSTSFWKYASTPKIILMPAFLAAE